MATLTDEQIKQLILEVQKYQPLFICKRGDCKYAILEELVGGNC